MNIYLIGYRGSGKTAVAACLAEMLGWPAIDADDRIELSAGRSIAEIFRDQGEATFRQLEAAEIERLAKRDRTIVSLGGGAVLAEENRRQLAAGRVVWLKASSETLIGRIAADSTTAARRPRLGKTGTTDDVAEILRQREPIYCQCADFQVDTEEKSPPQVAEEIAAWLEQK